MTGKILIASVLATSLAVLSSATSAAASDAQPFTFAKPVAVEQTATSVTQGDLRKIAASQFDLFFGGEFASRTFSFFALPNELSDDTKLVLTMQTAISVAPEESLLVVKVNGAEVGTAKLAAGNPRRLEFSVPAAVIQPGYNAVTITANQRHRVDCSIDATYELWTKIDPERSGFVFAGSQRPGLTIVDLLSLSGTHDGKTAMRIVVPPGMQSAEYDRALKVVQALTILGNFDHPTVEFAAQPGTGPGIDIHVGTKAQLGETLGADHRALLSAEQLVVEAAGGDRRRLILSGNSAEELDNQVDQLLSLAATDRPVGTPEGLSALVNLKGRTMAPGQKTALRELGFQGSRFAGRYSVSQVNFTMPSDFYPGDYGSMSFYLSALYVGGLAPGAELVVKANDKVVASIPLNSTRAGEIRDQRLPIPFSVLRPGQNTFRIEARLPTRQDVTCESVAKASSTVRLAINEGSYFDVENYARVGRYPDLAGLSSGFTLNKAVDGNRSTYLFVPQGDPQGMNAAATFVAKMAYAARQIQKVEFTSILPVGEDASLIAFGSYNNLPSELTGRMNLDFVNLETAAKASPFEVASLNVMPIDTQLDAGPRDVATIMEGAANLSDYTSAFLSEPFEETGALLNRAKTGIAGQLSRLNLKYLPALLGDERREIYSPDAQAAVVMAQQSTSTGNVWTVIAARNANAIATQTEVLTDRNVWNRLGGSVQSFSETGQVIDQRFSKDEHLFQTQPLTFSNARLVAAGWLANNAEIYVGALLSAAILLGLGTFMVLVTGRRHDHG
ncbi:MAG: cellulose biosynthesis cyclic di-GMP-binding regulatory protein BcsB [Rhizobium sp.]|nr:cellulose biosynthesis cyclic di-GMP-binding regulatory protein BcsB [Rhizobium sp.]